ncbi:MAG: ATP-dependent DNA ligase [Actinobacteria bacterium]|nr:ATP-dependent DNA ligase [Actinomycetota bacterium]
MLLADLVAASDSVAATSSRTAKIAAFADVLRALHPDEVPAAIGFLTGAPRQGKVGIGWATLAGIERAPASAPSITVLELDSTIDRILTTRGGRSAAARRDLVAALLERATARESDFIRRLFVGELRQGALEGVVGDAIAKAAGVPAARVRRAAMLTGDLGEAARLALTAGGAGLDSVELQVLRPVLPMLAGTAETVADALGHTGPSSVELKLDGARIQVHRSGNDVRVFTRNLNDITARLPDVVELVRAMPVGDVVLDGEAIGVGEDARPHRFQDTMRRFSADTLQTERSLRAWFFDVLRVDGTDLLEAPLRERLAVLDQIAQGHRIPAVATEDADVAASVLDEALAAGHEGVMVKSLESPYDAGRRGGSWRKVKPVRTLELVVLAVEWGHGRRRSWLSNLHLGARGADGFVMVGKTFKGLTDELLTWQTKRLQELAIGQEGHVVHVKPELVVEIALDGVQVSPRYPGGVALRFARVRRYRTDRSPADADTIETVQSML